LVNSDAGAIPKNFVDLKERHLLFEYRNIFWFTLSADKDKPCGGV